MVFLFQLLCTGYFAALTWTLYLVLSTPGPTNRTLLLGIGVATAFVVGLDFALGAPLGIAKGGRAENRFFVLMKFEGALVVLHVVNPWLRRTFANRIQQPAAPNPMTEKLLAVQAFLLHKVMYIMLYLFLVLAIWDPRLL